MRSVSSSKSLTTSDFDFCLEIVLICSVIDTGFVHERVFIIPLSFNFCSRLAGLKLVHCSSGNYFPRYEKLPCVEILIAFSILPSGLFTGQISITVPGTGE